jgi:hypothetical protein
VDAITVASTRRLAKVISGYSEDTIERIFAWLKSEPLKRLDLGPLRLESLKHPLSDHLAPHATDKFHNFRSLTEHKSTEQFDIKEALATFEGFKGGLIKICGHVRGRQVGFRTGQMTTVPDRLGQCVRYPGAEAIERGMLELFNGWRNSIHHEPGMAAIGILAGIAWLHPFEDGNGRVARMLFNASLTFNHVKRNAYVPLYEASALSLCGFLLRLRQAQYHREWTPLCNFVVHVAEVWTTENWMS